MAGKGKAAAGVRGSSGDDRAELIDRNANSPTEQNQVLPVLIAQWWRDRSGRAVRVQLDSYEGHNLIDVRTWWTNDAGKLQPGKGFACSVRHLPQLAKAIDKAVTKARELGLIPASGAGHD
jgi:hypothetical protein